MGKLCTVAATFHGLSVSRYVGNKMATFVMQSMGCDVSAINTVNYSTIRTCTIRGMTDATYQAITLHTNK
jgi:pyridoxal/pyridoxine/pyridoxamine kinase